MAQQTYQATGLTNWAFFSITVIAALVFFLNEIKNCESADFCSFVIFSMIFALSAIMLILLGLITGSMGKQGFSFKGTQFFFMQDPTTAKLLVIPVGLAAVLLISYVANLINNPLIGIFGSGIIMMIAFFGTNMAMVPIAIHGIYNAIVVGLRETQGYQLFATSPIYVPDIGYDLFNQTLLSELFVQLFLVAPAEELLKIFMFTAFIVLIRLRFKWDDFVTNMIAGTIGVTLWSIFHLSVALS